MSCTGVNALNPICRIGEAAASAANDAFSNIAGWFGKAASQATTWLWAQIGSATSVNLHSPQLSTDLLATSAIAVVLCLGLFLVQVITSVLRREPSGLGRAVKGLAVSLVASVFALAVTRILLGVVDSLSEGVVSYTMGTNIAGLGAKLAIGGIDGVANPAVVLLFSMVILAAVVVVWAAMMIRKMMIIIAAVLTPLAFSGATADITRGWVRRWVEFMAAMIASKLLLVIIFMIGVSVIDGAGISAQPGPGQQLTQLATGSLILLLGGFAPWTAIKMFHFTGDALHTAHISAAAAPSGARTVLAAPQKLNVMHSQASGGLAKLSDTGAVSPAGSHPPREDSKLLPQRPANSGHPGEHVNPAATEQTRSAAATSKPLTAGTGSSAAAAGSGGAATAGGSAAAAAVVAPVVAGATSVAALKQAAVAAASKAGQAAPPPPPTSPPPTSPVQHGPRFQKPS
jgi:type IV secretion system protein TrbL